MRLICWNVNGIRAVYKKGFEEWFMKEHPDVLCLQETKAKEEQVPEDIRDVPEYCTYFNSPKDKGGYSGVALYSKKRPNKVDFGLDIDRFDEEGRTIIAHYDDFILYNIYFPNGKASPERLRFKIDFYEAFLSIAREKIASGSSIVVCGDVNTAHMPIDLARPKENEKISGFLPEERAWIDRFLEAGFIDTLRYFDRSPEMYTWWDMKSRARERNVGWRIDYFFVSKDLVPRLKSASLLSDVMGSDHCPISLELRDG